MISGQLSGEDFSNSRYGVAEDRRWADAVLLSIAAVLPEQAHERGRRTGEDS